MKKLQLPLALLGCLLLGACAREAIPNVTVPAATELETQLPAPAQTDISGVIDAAKDLKQIDGKNSRALITSVTTGAGLQAALNGDHSEYVSFKSDAQEDVLIAAGDYAGSWVLVDAPEANLTLNAPIGALRLDAAKSCTLTASAGLLSVYGANIAVTLSGGAENVYIEGKNCVLRVTGGEYGVIYCLNQTVKVENASAATLYVTMGSGVTHPVAPGESLSF